MKDERKYDLRVEFGGFACEEEMRAFLQDASVAFNAAGKAGNDDGDTEKRLVSAICGAAEFIRDWSFGKSGAGELSQYEKRLALSCFVLGKAMLASRANDVLHEVLHHMQFVSMTSKLNSDMHVAMLTKLFESTFGVLSSIGRMAGELMQSAPEPDANKTEE